MTLLSVLCLPATSCFTNMLWGGLDAVDFEAERGVGRTSIQIDNLSDLAGKLLLTPFTLLLDCLTLPVQEALIPGAEDEEVR